MKSWHQYMRKDNKFLKVIQYICLVLGTVSVLYYLWIISYIGFKRDFSLIWPCMSVLAYGFAWLIHYEAVSEVVFWKYFIYVVLLTAFVGLIIFAILEGMIIKSGLTEPSADADYIIVLGAHVNGTTVSKVLRYRLDTAADYLEKNEGTKAIVSGGQGAGEKITEAEAMSQYLINKGISAERIIKENKSVDTNQNIEFSKKFICYNSHDDCHIVIVTSRFHLYRSMKIAKKQLPLFKIEGSGAKTGTGLFVNYYVREAVGVIKDTVFGNM